MKSVTDLSLFKQTVYHLLNNISRERLLCFVCICSTCIWGLGLCACMSHVYLGHVPSILTDRKHISYSIFPVWLHVAVEQTVLHRKFIPCLAVSLKSHLSKHQGVPLHSFLGGKRICCTSELGRFEESACCLQETVLSSWKCGRRGMDQAGQ